MEPIIVTSETLTTEKFNTLRVFAKQNGIALKTGTPTRAQLTNAIKRFWNKGNPVAKPVSERGRGRPALMSGEAFKAIWMAHPNDLAGVVADLAAHGVTSKMGLESYACARAHALRTDDPTAVIAFRRGRKPAPVVTVAHTT